MGLSDGVRATVYARDKAICAFSGISVWMPDYGANLLAAHDWPDHIKPASRKGGDTPGNLVCASSFYNRKKLNNSSDTSYLFIDGQPTSMFFWNIGCISAEQVKLIKSHEKICTTDWYFNRALANINSAHQNKYYKSKAVRESSYWLTAAAKRLSTWKKLGGINDFVRRGLIQYPKSPDIQLMLELSQCADSIGHKNFDRRVKEIYEELYLYFFANSEALHTFITAETIEARKKRCVTQ